MYSGCDAEQLQDDRQAKDYYDDRYTGEYMQDWPVQKQRRVEAVIRGLNLGESGVAVDLGCGVGVFSRVLKNALPAWRVIGLEISPNAVAAAQAKHHDIEFKLLGETPLESLNADFVFTHHVLEHVIDLDDIWQQIQAMTRPGARVMHILPCGDAGSFEHRLSRQQRGGIDAEQGNRFFYEDPGHVRRLTWQGLCDAAEGFGFKPDRVRYANQFWGGLAWISQIAPKKAKAMAQPGQATSAKSRVELSLWRVVLDVISTANRWKNIWQWRRENAAGLKGKARLLFGLPTGFVGLSLCAMIDRLAEREWHRDQNMTGSEMYALLRAAETKPQTLDQHDRQAA